jgi:hypothetical protein
MRRMWLMKGSTGAVMTWERTMVRRRQEKNRGDMIVPINKKKEKQEWLMKEWLMK